VLGNYVGVFENVSAAFPAWTEATPVRHADADAASEWLAASEADFPTLAPRPGAARLVFLNPDSVAEPYYYTASSLERDRGTALAYETANAWGDGDGLFFHDMRALPSHLGEFSTGGIPANFDGFPPYFSYGATPSERDRLVGDLARYTDTAVRQLIAPSFGVAPFAADTLTLDITLFDNTGAGTALFPGGVGAPHGIESEADLLDEALVRAALADLVPYSVVDVRAASSTRAGDPDLAAALLATSSVQGGATILDPFALSDRLEARWAVPPLPVEPGEDLAVPVLLVVEDGPAWVDTESIRGVTLQRSDGRAAGIVIAAGLDQLADRAFSETVIHEAGHALGLAHPHEISFVAGNGSVVTQVDWLHSLSSTPMTYLPAYVDYTFDGFDRRSLWEGAAAATLGIAYQLRQTAYQRLDSLGYNRTNIPAAIASHEALFATYAANTVELLHQGVLYIDPAPPYSAGGAVLMAKRAYDEAKDIASRAALAPRCCGGRPPGIIPGFDAVEVVAAAVAAASASALVARRRRL
jgi:hypothetical protein